MLMIAGNEDVDTEVIDVSLENEVSKMLDERIPSHEARIMTNGKKKENRFIIRNSQGDLKSDILQYSSHLDDYIYIFLY